MERGGSAAGWCMIMCASHTAIYENVAQHRGDDKTVYETMAVNAF